MNGITFIAVATAAIAAIAWNIWWVAVVFLALAFINEVMLWAARADALSKTQVVPEHERVIE